MPPIQLAYDTEESSCFSSILSKFSAKPQNDDHNEKFIYSSIEPMDNLPSYHDIAQSMAKLDVKCDSEIENVIHKEIDSISQELRDISLDLHNHAETGTKECHAHDILTTFLEKKGFTVTRHAFGLTTGFTAEYSRGSGRRIGVCSEYNALPGLGQDCGHNLIAISGLATAMAIKSVLEAGKANGKVMLFGTAAEEISTGKILMLRKKAFQDNIDVCLMLRPAAVNHQYGSFTAVHDVHVEFTGKPSHASASPWDGVNALDALVQVWNSISMMRQQLLPTDKIHGIVTNGGQAPNVIPEHASALFYIRAAKASQIQPLQKKFEACFEAAALATGCRVKYTWRELGVTKDVVQNDVMADIYSRHMEKYGIQFPPKAEQISVGGTSTDLGNVSYELPCVYPMFSIHTDASNHSIEFTKAAKTEVAHKDTITASKCLAATAVEVLINKEFYEDVKSAYNDHFQKNLK